MYAHRLKSFHERVIILSKPLIFHNDASYLALQCALAILDMNVAYA